ncbi:hypothetical protein FA048_18535 [Pedobacter polaris]|uniref:IPTL-CTERM protein sorting domain-containing protein n=1 Tax=Pedobacter polaris TaxID=2571273 RepID=A0A4U1CIB3_9SPHI|nr:hypothetical protein [Pedobacter polaris]TKC05710.1 hypothetical protein FA048_18535 [Pedobacter polaris]
MLKFIAFFLFFIFTSIQSKAATGCVPNANKTRIYTKRDGGPSSTIYKSSPFSTANSGCLYVGSSPCTITGVGAGTLGDTTLVACPIDDYIWLLMISFGGLGYFALRKKPMIFHYSSSGL